MEPQMLNVLFGRIILEELEKRQSQSRRQSADRPGVVGRFSATAIRRVFSHMPPVGSQLIRISRIRKPYGAAR
jgi:hypothetical protein